MAGVWEERMVSGDTAISDILDTTMRQLNPPSRC